MLTQFSYVGDDDPGFDDERPPWVMVRLNHHRYVVLQNGDRMHVECMDPDVASLKFDDDTDGLGPHEQRLRLHGASTGATHVEARRYQVVKAKLVVHVYRQREVHVNFFRVTDVAGDVPRFHLAKAKALCDELTEIYKRQANFVLLNHLAEDVTIKVDFATEFQSADQQTAIWDAVDAKRQEYDASDSHLNVFWVKKWGARNRMKCGKKRIVIGTARDIGDNLCIVEDVPNHHEQVNLLAHELGHCLGAHHDEAREAALMYPYLSEHTKLYRHTVHELRADD
jgi:hypothetical protein